MMEKLVENQIFFYCAGIAIILGFFIKMIVGISLNRLVRAASNMSKSNHSFMRLVRAKYEHGCMVSDRVQNVSAFVDKYMYEYKLLGIPLRFLRQSEKSMIWLCGLFSVLGGICSYYIDYDLMAVQQYAVLGGAGVGFLVLLQLTVLEKAKLDAVKMYMVDFLDNTYAHRYEKSVRKEVQPQEIVPEAQPQQYVQEEVRKEQMAMQGQAVVPETEELSEKSRGKAETSKEEAKREEAHPVFPQQEPELQPVQADRIREILEEFLA